MLWEVVGGRTARRLQYSTLIKHSIGALATLRAFLILKRVGFIAMSASSPTTNVAAASDRPMIVRYCMCQPYESFLHLIISNGRVIDVACDRVHRIWVPNEVGEGVGE